MSKTLFYKIYLLYIRYIYIWQMRGIFGLVRLFACKIRECGRSRSGDWTAAYWGWMERNGLVYWGLWEMEKDC